MKLHPREEITRKARMAFYEFRKNKDWSKLSSIEEAQIFTEQLDTYLKYALRAERHPDDPERPGGIE